VFCGCAFLAGLLFAGNAAASLARTLSFAEISKSAEIVADVTVQNAQSYWAAPAGVTAIRTHVSFLVLQSVKGNPDRSFTLDFLGGEVDGPGLQVPDVPQFLPWERYILFCAAPGKALVCPVLGLTGGPCALCTTMRAMWIACFDTGANRSIRTRTLNPGYRPRRERRPETICVRPTSLTSSWDGCDRQ
jgi:hypothetical protein